MDSDQPSGGEAFYFWISVISSGGFVSTGGAGIMHTSLSSISISPYNIPPKLIDTEEGTGA